MDRKDEQIIDNLAIIVAIAKNGAIGKNNKLLWHIPEDLKYFKLQTLGHPVIMGWNTWLSLPKKPLPDRLNIILSQKNSCLDNSCIVFNNLNDCLNFVRNYDKICFIIGGASIFKQTLPHTKKLYITWIDKNYPDADTFFPIDEIRNFNLISENIIYSESIKSNIRFCVYSR
jgi:dihydrofolate reductase